MTTQLHVLLRKKPIRFTPAPGYPAVSVKANLVLTIISEDRPGLVDQLSRTVVKFDANWESSRMARLGGQFAGILLVSVDEGRADGLEAALAELAKDTSMTIVVQRSDADEEPAERNTFRLELVGTDHPGIIHDISHVLAAREVNVEEMRSDCDAAPMGGGDLFKMAATLTSPPNVDVEDLRTALEEVANDLMVDITLRAPDA